MDEPTSVSELLQRAQLQQYVAAFEEQGYDSLSQLHGITDEDLTELIADVNMKKGHVKRLLEALGRKGSAGGSSTAPAAPAAAMPAAAQPQPAAPENAGQHEHVPPSAATNEAAQADLYKRLVQREYLGEMVHGNIIDTYRAPQAMGGEIMIQAASLTTFFCRCCPVKSGDSPERQVHRRLQIFAGKHRLQKHHSCAYHGAD